MRTQHKHFVEYYIQLKFNGEQAALKAGYSPKGARQRASLLLTRDDVQEYLAKRLKEMQVSSDEVLLLLAQQARGEIPTKVTKNPAFDEVKEEYDTNKALSQIAKTMAMFIDRKQVEIEGLDIIFDDEETED